MPRQLRELFLEDMDEKLDRLEELMRQMETNGADSEVFNEFYGIVHSLKGSGGSYGLQVITTICHQLEDRLSTAAGGTQFTPTLLATCSKFVDLLWLIAKGIQAGDETFLQVEDKLNELGTPQGKW